MSKIGGWEPTGFAARLKALREAAGLSQPELAEKAGCHKITVSKLERGEQEPAWPLVLSLCKALGVTCEAFRGTGAVPAREQLAVEKATAAWPQGALEAVSCTGALLDGAIELRCDKVRPDDVGKFARLFAEAWAVLSQVHQRLIARYWRGRVVPRIAEASQT